MQMLKAVWKWFWSPTKRFAWGAILITGGIGGILFWGGFNTFMEYTNTQEFCISCHEMRQTVYQEYKKTPHYNNASGVQAICSDCHVPKPWGAKLVKKIKATRELFHSIMGSIDTPEKFEAKRLEMAKNVWRSMKANDSRECRNCHSFENMDFKKQTRRAALKMQEGRDDGKTCIDCHKGIAHKLAETDDDDR